MVITIVETNPHSPGLMGRGTYDVVARAGRGEIARWIC